MLYKLSLWVLRELLACTWTETLVRTWKKESISELYELSMDISQGLISLGRGILFLFLLGDNICLSPGFSHDFCSSPIL